MTHRRRQRRALENPIAHPPRNIHKWLRAIHKKSVCFYRACERLQAFIDNDLSPYFPDDEDTVDELVRYGTGLDLYDLKRVTSIADKVMDSTRSMQGHFEVASSLSEALRWSGSSISFLLGEYGELTTLKGYAQRRSDYLDLENLGYYNEEEIPPNLLKVFEKFNDAFTAFVNGSEKSLRALEESLEEWGALQQRQWGKDGPDDKRPPSDAVERLYHASVNAVALYEEGFSLVVPESGGIGGSQTTADNRKGVSFTSDLYIAKEIAAVLKQLVALLQGSWKVSNFLRQLRDQSQKSYDEVVKAYKEDGRTFPPKKDVDVYELFNKYLWYAARFNPVLFGSPSSMVPALKRAKLEDIGVVAAEVDMADESIHYLRSMHEYRVPPEAILGVVELIR